MGNERKNPGRDGEILKNVPFSFSLVFVPLPCSSIAALPSNFNELGYSFVLTRSRTVQILMSCGNGEHENAGATRVEVCNDLEKIRAA